MNTRLKIICILFAIAYVVTLVSIMISQLSLDQSQLRTVFDVSKLNESINSLSSWGTTWLLIGSIFILLISLFGGFIFLFYIPFQIYKVIKSIVNDKIFDLQNIKRIRLIGYSILLYSALAIIFMYPFTKYILYLAAIEMEYLGVDVLSPVQEYFLLLIGLLTLLFAEVMKISHTIKEENDLTV